MILLSPNYLRSAGYKLSSPHQHEYKTLTCHAAPLSASSAAIRSRSRLSFLFSAFFASRICFLLRCLGAMISTSSNAPLLLAEGLSEWYKRTWDPMTSY